MRTCELIQSCGEDKEIVFERNDYKRDTEGKFKIDLTSYLCLALSKFETYIDSLDPDLYDKVAPVMKSLIRDGEMIIEDVGEMLSSVFGEIEVIRAADKHLTGDHLLGISVEGKANFSKPTKRAVNLHF